MRSGSVGGMKIIEMLHANDAPVHKKYRVTLTACTNTKVCLFGNRVIKVTKKKKRHHHHRVAVAAVPLHQAR